jgi:hypothetical protein
MGPSQDSNPIKAKSLDQNPVGSAVSYYSPSPLKKFALMNSTDGHFISLLNVSMNLNSFRKSARIGTRSFNCNHQCLSPFVRFSDS